MGNRDNPVKSSKRNADSKPQKPTSREDFYSISFRYFKNTDSPPAQSINTWKNEDKILNMLLALQYISSNNASDVQTTGKLSLYTDEYPPKDKNEFPLPDNLPSGINRWGTIQNIGGQKARIAGFLKDNIFYLVYLDKEHKFYKSKLRNT